MPRSFRLDAVVIEAFLALALPNLHGERLRAFDAGLDLMEVKKHQAGANELGVSLKLIDVQQNHLHGLVGAGRGVGAKVQRG